MKKYLLVLPLVLSLIACKKIKVVKGPDGKTSVCTVSNMQGVSSSAQDANTLQCVVLSCDPNFSKYNIQEFLTEYENERNSCLAYNEGLEDFCPEEVSPEIRQYVADYPKICTPAARECDYQDESILPGQGEEPWVGLNFRFRAATVSEEPYVEAGISMDEASPEDLISMGYGRCQPKNADSCAEGFIYNEFNESQLHGVANALSDQIVIKRCMAEEVSCYFNEESHITGMVQIYNQETQQYSDCTVTSCLEGYAIVDNSCQLIVPPDPCLINPQSNPSCPGYDMCIMIPMMPGCPGYNPCIMNPMDPMCVD